VTWFEAYDRALGPLFGPASLLAVLEAAEGAGVLAGLRTRATVEELAVATSQDSHVLAAICHALDLYDVVDRDGDRYHLAPDWMLLTDEAAFSPLSVQLAHGEVTQRTLRHTLGDSTYWTMSAEDRLVIARAVSPDPFSAGLVESFRTRAADEPDQAALIAGGTQLELGCGVAGRILTLLQAIPAMHAIGVEISPDLAAIARERAEELGLSHRFEVVVADATGFDREACADTAFWSQFFFPESSRAGALAAILRALRPGGVLTATLEGGNEADPKELALSRISTARWGIPARTPEQLVEEISAAGFTDVGVVTRDGLSRVRAVRP
jgi:SAM-dependent methyltransferase